MSKVCSPLSLHESVDKSWLAIYLILQSLDFTNKNIVRKFSFRKKLQVELLIMNF